MKEIVSTKDVLFGMPRIEGRRISVYNVVSSLWHDKDIKEFCNTFELNEDDILNALLYCKNLNCQKNNVIQFCDGCILRTLNEKKMLKQDSLKKIHENLFIDNDNNYYINDSGKNIEDEEFGYMGWVRAEILYNYFIHSNPDK